MYRGLRKIYTNAHHNMAVAGYLLAVKLLINAPAFIKTLASEPPASIRDRRLFETRRLI